MKTTFAYLLAPIAFASALSAQETRSNQARELATKVRAAITAEELDRVTRGIVDHERPSGSVGENAAIDHIVY